MPKYSHSATQRVNYCTMVLCSGFEMRRCLSGFVQMVLWYCNLWNCLTEMRVIMLHGQWMCILKILCLAGILTDVEEDGLIDMFHISVAFASLLDDEGTLLDTVLQTKIRKISLQQRMNTFRQVGFIINCVQYGVILSSVALSLYMMADRWYA